METHNSALLAGAVRHRRFTPVFHQLSYDLFMPCIDLDHFRDLESSVWGLGQKWWHWARFKRSDYLGHGDLKQAVLDKVFELTGEKMAGRVEAVIHLRYLGVYFSPVNFYYVYDEACHWRYLLAEVSNTPWNERHYYAIPAQSQSQQGQWQHRKGFHVSPFNPMDQNYHWRIKPLNGSLSIHLECHRQQKEFDATLIMKKQALTTWSLLSHLILTPAMAVKMLFGIYWQAFKLWCKNVPLYSHPKNEDEMQQQKNNAKKNNGKTEQQAQFNEQDKEHRR